MSSVEHLEGVVIEHDGAPVGRPSLALTTRDRCHLAASAALFGIATYLAAASLGISPPPALTTELPGRTVTVSTADPGCPANAAYCLHP